MRKAFSVLCFLLSFSINWAQADPVIQSIISKVSVDTLISNLRELTGDKPIMLNNVSTSLFSRNRYSVGNSYMPFYLMKKFDKLGLVSFQQNFMTDGQNVYAIQNGNKTDEYVIICAHYDNMPSGSFAPGADDNGSGTAAVLEAARILSKYKFNYTIIYALWDLEEYGLYGSNYYAQEANFRGDKIIAVINLDMIGWDGNSDNKAELHTKNVSTTNELGYLFDDINSKHSIGLYLFTINPGTDRSDHASFWRYGYPAVLLIESSSDFNPYYHKVTDDINKINKPYFERMTKLALGVTAKAAVPVNATFANKDLLPSDLKLYQNYPNPFNPETRIEYQIAKSSYVKLKVYDALGNEIAVLVDEEKQPGRYSVNFSVADYKISTGIYFYSLCSGNYNQTQKMILIK